MGKHTARLWLTGAMLTLGAALVPGGLWLATEQPEQQRQRLPDGSSLALLGWTYGSFHAFRTGPRWQTLLWPLSPPSVQERLRDVLEVRPQRTALNSLVLWMVHRPGPGNGMPVFLEVADERGKTLFSDTSGGYVAAGSGSRVPEPWVINPFPRRGKHLLVRPLEGLALEKRVPLAEFRIPNPDAGPHPTWTAPPLPVAQSRNDLTFKLTRLSTGLRMPGRSGPFQSDELPWSKATFRVEQAGRPTTNWYPASMVLSDPTSNRWEPRFATTDFTDTEMSRDLEGLLDADETYRLQVRFTNRDVVESRDQWALPAIPLPPPHASRPLRFVTTRNQLRIRVLEVLGPRAAVPNIVSPKPYPHVRLLVSPAAQSDGKVVLVRATDQRGRNILLSPNSMALGRDSSLYFRLAALPGVKALHLTFGIHRSYDVEFLARPVDARRAEAPGAR